MIIPRRFVAFVVLGTAVLFPLAHAQSTLTGMITNAATGRALEGARVSLKGTDRTALSDRQGAYVLDNVTPGPVALEVYYSGLDTVTVPATVTANQANRVDVKLTAQIYAMSQYVVAGEREGNAQAVTLQRLSAGVKNIVSTDAFGNLAGNPADLLVRLPGVEGATVDGTVRYVRIRGLNQNLTTITMDGNRLADAASAGSTREYQFQTVSADTVERLEVVKSPTPDMDGDSIGGAVNMVSKSGFDTKDRVLRGSFGLTYRPFDDRMTGLPYNYAVSYAEVFGGKLAVAANFGHRKLFTPQDTVNQSHQTPANGVTGPAYTFQTQFTDERLLTSRWGGGLRLDYKLDERHRVYLSTTVNRLTDHDTDRISIFTTPQAVATVDAAGNLTGTGGILPGFTNEFTAVRGVPNSTVNVQADTAYKDAKTLYHQFGGVHKIDMLNLDWNLYKSDSKSNYSGQRNFGFTARGIGYTIDRRANAEFPTVTQTSGPSIADLASFNDNRYRIDRRAGWDGYQGASLNAQKKFTTPVPSYLKVGVRSREQQRKLEATQWSGNYVGPDGVMGLNAATGRNDDNLAQFGLIERGELYTDKTRFPNVPVPAFPGHTNKQIDTVLETSPQLFVQEVAANVQAQLTGNQRFKERIDAAYVMGNVDLGRLSILAGVRVERTKTEGVGALQALTAEERARRAAYVGTPTPAELTRRTTAEYGGRQTRTGDYQEVLPGVHFKYSPTSQLVTRLSYSTNIGRPGIGQLIPRTTVNFDNQTISTANPSLKPQKADNFDFSAEYYFEPAGMVSVGVFHKEIKGFIYTAGGLVVPAGAENGFGGDYAGYVLTTQFNGGAAKVRGIELNYSQQFTFLPGIFGGLGAYANFTRMETEGNYGAGNAIALAPNPKGKVAGFNPETANFGLSYIRNKVTVRLQFNHRARYLTTYNVNVSQQSYAIRRDTLDLKTAYQFSRRLGVYLDVNNVLGEYETGTDIGPRPSSRRILTPGFFFGVNTRL
ncbi:TonB-dependent receptor [Horticoccus sp. 23ND18S-11]|uniref:TonB-dependent receptor n=1 Tax=Horticoccus sp. 23ND18S-11 TaxID=3391832 RepID=UPI0039C96A47